MKGIGAKLKLLRDKSGLSQAEVARRAGISKCYYWELEKAEEKAVSGDILYRIAMLHEVSMEWFFVNTWCARCGAGMPLCPAIFTAAHYFLQIQYLCPQCLEKAKEVDSRQVQEWKDWIASGHKEE